MAGFTYDLVRLYAQVRDLIPGRTAFAVRIDVWDHVHADGRLSVEVDIYDHSLGRHFRGPTPDVVLALLRAHYQPVQAEDLGLIAVPETA